MRPSEQVFGLDIFRRFYEPDPCIASYLEKHQNPSWSHLLLVTSRKVKSLSHV